jgi:hypothetical protein
MKDLFPEREGISPFCPSLPFLAERHPPIAHAQRTTCPIVTPRLSRITPGRAG